MVQTNYRQDKQVQFNHLKESQTVSEPVSSSPPVSSFNLETEIEDLAEIIIDAARIPLTDLAMVDIDFVLEQINSIKENLPIELSTASEIVNRRQELISEAEGYAYLVVKSAEEQAHKLVKESAIVRQAELDGAKIRLKTEQECEYLKQVTISEIEQLRKDAIAECVSIQTGADEYADGALADIENRLQKMLTIVQNGRQEVQ